MSGYSSSINGSTSSTWIGRRSRTVRPPIEVLAIGSVSVPDMAAYAGP